MRSVVGATASSERKAFHIYNGHTYKVGFSTLLDVNPKEKGYACVSFIVGKQDSSKIKVNITRIIRM